MSAQWPKWSPAPGWPSSHLLGGAQYHDSASHSSVEEFRARMKRRMEDAERAQRTRDRAIEDADAWIAEQVRSAHE